MNRLEALKNKLKGVPQKPGVYLMKDKKDKIIYVGKAKNLKNRISSYFNKQKHEAFKTRMLVKEIADFDVVLVQNEIEALLTERTLIKHHNPAFNILLRDDKEYPYVRVNFKEEWPRIEKVRRRKNDSATYLGPYSQTGYLNLILKSIQRIYPVVKCSRHEFSNIARPCTYYDMNMCLAPCHKSVDRSEYVAAVKEALEVLDGKNKKIRDKIKETMLQLSAKQEYEEAAALRDQLNALERVREKQSVVVPGIGDADFIGYSFTKDFIFVHVIAVREGLISHNDNFKLNFKVEDTVEGLSSFLIQYYEARFLPKTIYLDKELPDKSNIEEFLFQTAYNKSSQKIEIVLPKKGPKSKLLQTAMENAEFQLAENQKRRKEEKEDLEKIKSSLNLKKLPERMECIDISNLGAQAIVASNVCFLNGKPAKHLYRKYNVKTVTDDPDDFASINEVVRRRLLRAKNEDAEKLGPKLDLLVIDGGKGQLGAALEAKSETNSSVSIVSIAKSRLEKSPVHRVTELARSYERIFLEKSTEPILLRAGTPEFRILTYIRDEAHRFAITHHRSRRQKQAFHSFLDDVSGLGPVLKKRLLTELGSLDKIKKAKKEELSLIKGIHSELAEAIVNASSKYS